MKAGIVMASLASILIAAACAGGPSEAERHNERGLELIEQGLWRKAIEEYDKAIELDASMASAYLNRGQAYHFLGDNERAIADLDRAIELNPNLDLAYFQRGNTYEALGDSQQAIADYRRALSLTSDPYFAAVIETRIEYLEVLEEMGGQ